MDALHSHLRLKGQHAALEPLSADHAFGLAEAACDGRLWEIMFTNVPDAGHHLGGQRLEPMQGMIKQALENRDAGSELPFVVRRLSDNKIIGTTRYYAISPEHRNLSIGYTWYAKSVQRTAINTECKYLLLKYAFETLNCISVQWHVDHRNLASQKAVERLGAVKEGVLRNHKVMHDGVYRHTVCYSMLDDEWLQAKHFLQSQLIR